MESELTTRTGHHLFAPADLPMLGLGAQFAEVSPLAPPAYSIGP